MTAQADARKMAAMASRKSVDWFEFRVGVKPDYWLRRLVPFWPFFESTNPSLRVRMERLAIPPVPGVGPTLNLQIIYPDGTNSPYIIQTPHHLRVGQSANFIIPAVLCPHPGRMAIRFPLENGSFLTLYSYTVHAEERIWIPVFALAFMLIGVALQRFLLP